MLLTRRTALASVGATLAAACTETASEPAFSRDGIIVTANSKPKIRNPRFVGPQRPLPFAVQEIYPAAHKGKIHLAGGLLGEGGRVVGVSDRHIAYRPAYGVDLGENVELAPLPSPRHHPNAVSHKDRLYLLGGFHTNPGAVNWIMSTDTLIYNEAGLGRPHQATRSIRWVRKFRLDISR